MPWLCAEEIGAVLGFEASCLARDGRDWHHLLEPASVSPQPGHHRRVYCDGTDAVAISAGKLAATAPGR